MKKEYFVVVAIALFVLSYVLDSVVKPLGLTVSSPYQYFTSATLSLYPFSTTSIVIKAIGVTISTLLVISLIANPIAKGGALLLLSALFQLYALQDVATKSNILSLEWSLALTLAGVVLLIPSIVYFLIGGVKSLHHSINPYETTQES